MTQLALVVRSFSPLTKFLLRSTFAKSYPTAVVEWLRIYKALRLDVEDVAAWTALEKQVRGIARRTFGHLDGDTEDDVVADTLARVFVDLDRTQGAESFSGVVYEHFQNVRKAVLARRSQRDQPLSDLDFPAA